MDEKRVQISMNTKDLASKMKRFRKKFPEVSAKQMTEPFTTDDSETKLIGKPGDWVILSDDGFIFMCNSARFLKDYTELEANSSVPGLNLNLKATGLNMAGSDLFRIKPLSVYAEQMNCDFSIDTREGVIQGKTGDWLIKGFAGELSICRDEVFQKTYDRQSTKTEPVNLGGSDDE